MALFAVVVEAALTLGVLPDELLADEVFLAVAPLDGLGLVLSFLTLSGWLITLAEPAVGVSVQYQVPLASAQLWPSGALE